MRQALEHKLEVFGMTKLDRLGALWFYTLYIVWFFLRISALPSTTDISEQILLYTDGINIVMCLAAFWFAWKMHFWMERIAAHLIGINAFVQVGLYTIAKYLDGGALSATQIILATFFASYFFLRGLGLSIRMTRAKKLLGFPPEELEVGE